MQHKPFYDRYKLFRPKSFLALLLLICGLLYGSPTSATLATGAYTVNTTTDAVDANIGNGVCATSNGECSLRAAIQKANASFAAQTITLPAGRYKLTIEGDDEESAVTGEAAIPLPMPYSLAAQQLATHVRRDIFLELIIFREPDWSNRKVGPI